MRPFTSPKHPYRYEGYTGRLIILAIALLAFGFAQPEARSAPAQTIKLKVAHFMPDTNAPAAALKKAMDYIVKKSNGKIKYAWYPNGSLLGAPQVYDGLTSGMCDIGLMGANFTPGRFPLTEVLGLPPAFVNARESLNNWQFFKDYLLDPHWTKEWSKVKVLTLVPGDSNSVISNRPVRSLADAKGLRVCGFGANLTSWVAWGGTPMNIGPADAYEAIQRGLADAAYFTSFWARGRKGAEVAPYCTMLGVDAGYVEVVMNQEKYNSLPGDMKALFNEVFPDKYNIWAVELCEQSAKADIDFILQSKGEFITLSREKLSEFRIAAVQGRNEKWATEKDSKGLPGTKILQERYNFLKQYMPDIISALGIR